jgi:hypothetical protein
VQNHVYEDSGRDANPEDREVNLIDFHVDEGNGLTKTTFARKKVGRLEPRSNSKNKLKTSVSPIKQRAYGDSQDGYDHHRQVNYGTFGAKEGALNQVRITTIVKEGRPNVGLEENNSEDLFLS